MRIVHEGPVADADLLAVNEPDQARLRLVLVLQDVERAGTISDSIVRSINLASVGTTKGYALPIEGVGTLYLGNVIVKPGERRLAMIRLDLGGRGMITVGLHALNGDTMP